MNKAVPGAPGAWKLLLAIAATGLLPMANSAIAQQARSPVAEGKRLAEKGCVRCHVVVPTGKPGWTDAPAFDAIANRPGATAARLSTTIQAGHTHMLNDQRPKPEADAIAAYIISLRKR